MYSQIYFLNYFKFPAILFTLAFEQNLLNLFLLLLLLLLHLWKWNCYPFLIDSFFVNLVRKFSKPTNDVRVQLTVSMRTLVTQAPCSLHESLPLNFLFIAYAMLYGNIILHLSTLIRI